MSTTNPIKILKMAVMSTIQKVKDLKKCKSKNKTLMEMLSIAIKKIFRSHGDNAAQ